MWQPASNIVRAEKAGPAAELVALQNIKYNCLSGSKRHLITSFVFSPRSFEQDPTAVKI